MRPAWIEVNRDALRMNIRNLKRCVAENVIFMGVIKADGYGHGAIEVGNILREEGCNHFAVAMVEEAVLLRENGFSEPILILGRTMEDDCEALIEYRLIPIIDSYEQALHLNTVARERNATVPVHVKIDTGMGRLGFLPGPEAIADIKRIALLPNLFVQGILSHLSSAAELNDSYTEKQFSEFMTVVRRLEDEGIRVPVRHVANSAATMRFPHMHLDMVRPGTSLYGLYPSPYMKENPIIQLHSAMSVKARLVRVKRVPPGTCVSYSRTFVTKRDSVLGVVPMGYVDGVFRQLANRGEVLIRERRCPIVGNICMDQFVVDLTDLPHAETGDEVVVIGTQGDEAITADEVAEKAGTISIEIVTRLGKRMPIRYL